MLGELAGPSVGRAGSWRGSAQAGGQAGGPGAAARAEHELDVLAGIAAHVHAEALLRVAQGADAARGDGHPLAHLPGVE